MAYNRYRKFIENGRYKVVPFIKIPKRSSDYYVKYNCATTRLDIVSQQYYEDPNYGWLILQANPSLGTLEYEIQNGSILRVPYPLENAIEDYENGIDNYNKLYGIE